jgi:hypothetical protein
MDLKHHYLHLLFSCSISLVPVAGQPGESNDERDPDFESAVYFDHETDNWSG